MGELIARQHLYGRAVALEAADRDRRRAAHHFAEEIIERGQNLPGLGMMAALLLVHLLLMTIPAVVGRDDDRYGRAIVLEGIGIARLSAMAVEAVDAFLPMDAGAPFFGERGIHRPMAAERFALFCPPRRTGRGRLWHLSRHGRENTATASAPTPAAALEATSIQRIGRSSQRCIEIHYQFTGTPPRISTAAVRARRLTAPRR